ncbi:MAG: hypothetical protein KBD65_03050 [Candidatus Moranbacteria bacterium]|nr:hypothetical protein [Candidatus Moranbacteria bacterium]
MSFENPLLNQNPGVEKVDAEKEKKISSRKLAYLVAGALGIGAAGYKVEQVAEDVIDQVKEELRVEVPVLKENAMDLVSLNEKFSARMQIESESGQYIIHIAQVHGQAEGFQGTGLRQYLPEFVEKEIQGAIANQQVEIGQLTVLLKERYGINGVLQEGSVIDGESNLEDVRSAAFEVKKPLMLAIVFDELRDYERFLQKPVASFDEYKQGLMKLGNLQRAKDFYQSELEALQSGGVLDKQVWRLAVNKPSVDGLQAMITGVEEMKQKYEGFFLEKYPDFEKKYAYHYGGPGLMQGAGKIEVSGAETTAGNESIGSVGHAEGNKLREDVAISLAVQQMIEKGGKYVPITYGMGHDFSRGVAAYNQAQTNPKYKIGLIRIDNKVVESLAMEHDLLRFRKIAADQSK